MFSLMFSLERYRETSVAQGIKKGGWKKARILPVYQRLWCFEGKVFSLIFSGCSECDPRLLFWWALGL